jgi:hypothetical protein
VSRRALLAGVPLLALAAACRPHSGSATTGTPTTSAGAPDVDAIRLRAAILAEQRILADYERYLTSLDGVVEPLPDARAAHQAHLRALGATLPPHAGRHRPLARLPELRRQLTSSAATLRTAAVRADSGGLAAVLASIGASHAALAAAGTDATP